MAMMQMLAAEIAGVTGLVFHAVDRSGIELLDRAKTNIMTSDIIHAANTEDLITKIVSMRYQWGVGNGT